MTGVLNVVAASATAVQYTVTVAENATGIFGYNDSASPTGSISPSALKGATIRQVSCRTVAAGSPDDIGISLQGNLAQSFFSALVVQRTDGAIRRYATSQATTFIPGSSTIWGWDNDDPAWTATGSRFLLLYF